MGRQAVALAALVAALAGCSFGSDSGEAEFVKEADAICAQHEPGESIERRWLHGAACHGCTFIAETSCEMHNDYLDRALVVPVIGVPGAAFL